MKPENWEAEFEKQFVDRPFEPDGDWAWKRNATPYNIVDFIRDLLHSQAEEVRKKIYESKQTVLDHHDTFYNNCPRCNEISGRNIALDLIDAFLSTLTTKR